MEHVNPFLLIFVSPPLKPCFSKEFPLNWDHLGDVEYWGLGLNDDVVHGQYEFQQQRLGGSQGAKAAERSGTSLLVLNHRVVPGHQVV